MSARNDQRKRVEIKRRLVIIGLFNRSEEFVAQAKIQSQAGSYLEVVEAIHRINLPVIDDVVKASNLSAVRNAKQKSGNRLSARTGRCGIVGEVAAERHVATGGGWLEYRELFEAKFSAKLRGVASLNPAQIVGKNITVLMFICGQVFRAANSRSTIAEADRRQAAEIRPIGYPGKIKLLRDIDVVVQVVAMGLKMIESEAKFVEQIVAECV